MRCLFLFILFLGAECGHHSVHNVQLDCEFLLHSFRTWAGQTTQGILCSLFSIIYHYVRVMNKMDRPLFGNLTRGCYNIMELLCMVI